MKTAKNDELADRLDDAKPRRTEFDTALAQFEARWASGFVRQESGSLSAADGLVARSGNRRIFPGWMDDTEELEELYADWLRDLAERVLTGPAAIVFRGRVLDPLAGKPQRSFQGLAAEIGSNTARVYKLLELSIRKLKVAAMHRKHFDPKPDPMPQTKCPTCGVVYAVGNWSACKRGYSHLVIFNQKSPHPQCFPDWVMYRPKGKRA